MATLYTRKDSPYLWAWGYDASGQVWYKSTKQKPSARARAQKVADAIERRRLLGPPEVTRISLLDALRLLREQKELKKVAPATLTILGQLGRNLLRLFGPQRDISTLEIRDTEEYLRRRRGEVFQGRPINDATIAKELEALIAALRAAKRYKLYDGEPKDLWPPALPHEGKPRTRWLPVPEYQKLLAHCAERRRDDIIMYCHTGMRKSELYSLTADSVDLTRGILKVSGTKTASSVRTVPISSAAEAVLARRLQDFESGPLFPQRWDRGQQYDDLKLWCARAGIVRVSCNDFRRTYCSWLFLAGVPEARAVKYMGHSSSKMIRRVYMQLAEETYREDAAGLPAV